jgi:hypothetical protein
MGLLVGYVAGTLVTLACGFVVAFADALRYERWRIERRDR